MQALWLSDQKLYFRKNVPITEPGPGEALVRVLQAGICSTDLEMVKGYASFTGVLGHEFVGRVEDAPDNPDWIGKRIVAEINLSCGLCPACKRGEKTHCLQRKVLGIRDFNGVFADYCTLPIENLHVVPAGVTDDHAVFTEPLAAALEILEQVHIHPSDRVLVIGAGRLGQLIAQVLALTGCRLQVVARHSHQRVILEAHQITAITQDQINNQSQDLVVEATGSPGGFGLAKQAVRARGTIVLKSTYADSFVVNLSDIVVDEITLLGSRCGPFEPALALLAEKRVDPSALIRARYSLADGLAAFAKAGEPGGFKVLIEMD